MHIYIPTNFKFPARQHLLLFNDATLMKMDACLWFLNIVSVTSAVAVSSDNVPPTLTIGDPRHCQTSITKNSGNYKTLQILPGRGWDNLQNKEMSQIFSFSFSNCQTTDDGKYLIPDSVVAIPVKSSTIDSYAEYFEHYNNYTSTLSRSINMNAGLQLSSVGISGKFSEEYHGIKSFQMTERSVMTRSQARYVQYTVNSVPETPLNQAFKNRLSKIAAHFLLNRTEHASYESQLLVRDYGTHVVTSVDAGATLVQVDGVAETYWEKYKGSKKKLKSSASGSFFKVFHINPSYDLRTSTKDIEEYESNRTYSEINTIGGSLFRPENFSADKWAESVAEDLVYVDRSGDPIYYQITNKNLPGVPQSTVFDVYDAVKAAVNLYYETNTYRGCTQIGSPNFSFQANLDDGSCETPTIKYEFGGAYQTCKSTGKEDLCQGLIQKNPLTGGFTCPDGYADVELETLTKESSSSNHECRRCFKKYHCCKNKIYHSTARYTSHWCARTKAVQKNTGLLFGGLYTSKTDNVITQSKACPMHYYSLSIMNMKVCVSDDFELGIKNSLPFGGFYSCHAGNPWLKLDNQSLKEARRNTLLKLNQETLSKGCPSGYSQHHATIIDGCAVNYCVQTGMLSVIELPKLQRPPFMEAPRSELIEEEDVDETVIDNEGTLWSDMTHAEEIIPECKAEYETLNSQTQSSKSAQVQNESNNDKTISGHTVLTIVLSVTIAVFGVVTLFVYFVRRKKSGKRLISDWNIPEEEKPIISSTDRLS